MSLYSLYVASGATGTFHDSTSPTFTNFLAGLPLYLSFNLVVARTTGTENATLLVQINWKDSAGNALTAWSNSWGLIGSSDGVQKLTVTPPANAVSGTVYIKVTPGASNVMQHNVTIKKLRLGKNALAADVTSDVAAIGDANRVRYSLFEAGTTGWSYINQGGFSSPNFRVIHDATSDRVAVTGNWTAANQYAVLLNDAALSGNTKFRIPVIPGERLFVSAFIEVGGVTGTWQLSANFKDNNNGAVSAPNTTGSGTVAINTRVGFFVTVPAGAVYMSLELYLFGLANTSGAFTLSMGRPMVCSAGPSQTAWSSFSPGPTGEPGATAGATWGTNVGSIPAPLSAVTGTTNIDNTLVGLGQNVIINSDFSRVGNNTYGWAGAWGGNVANGVASWSYNLPGTPNWYGVNNVAFSTHSYDGTGAGGTVWDGHTHLPAAPGNPIPLADLQRWALPVQDGDRIFAGCLLAHHRCAAEIHVTYYDSSGAYIGEVGGGPQGRDGGAANGDPANFDRATYFGNVLANARFARMNIRATVISGQANPYIFYTQMMLCKIAAGQTTAPPWSPGPISDHGAEVNRWIVGPPQSTVFKYDYTGVAQTGQFARTMTFTLMSSSGAMTSGVTWSLRVINGGYNGVTSASGSFVMPVSAGIGSLNVASMQSSSATIEVTASYNGQSYTKQFTITQDIAAAPVSNGGSTGVTTVASKSSGFSTLGSTSFVDVSGPITGAMPTGKTTATVSVQLDVAPQGAGTGSWPIEMKLMRDVGGTPTQIGTTQSATATWDDTAKDGNDASFNFTVSDTGLTAGTSYNWRVYVRDAGATRNFYVIGTVTVTA